MSRADELATYDVGLRGGSHDGKTIPVPGDPTDPPGAVHVSPPGSPELTEVYTPRLNPDDHGPIWLYVYIRTDGTSM